jgi:hypothetical protein
VAAVAICATLAGCGGGTSASAPLRHGQVRVPRTAGLQPEAAVAALCRAGLRPAARGEVIGEPSAARRRALAEALRATRTPAERVAVLRRFVPPVRVLGTDPDAGTPVGSGATVVIRLGVLKGTTVSVRPTCS